MMEKIKLLFINVSMRFGGVEAQLLDLLTGLDERQFDLSLGLCNNEGDFLKRLPPSVKVYGLNHKIHSGLNPELIPGEISLIRKVNPHLIISFHDVTNIETYIAAKLEGRSNKVLGCFPGKVTSGRLDWVRIPFLSGFNQLICVGDGVAYSLKESYGYLPNVTVIPNCVDVNQVQIKATEMVDHPWFTTKSIPVGISVGRVVKSKNIEAAIRTVMEINKTRPFRFIVVGDGPDLDRLKKFVSINKAEKMIDFVGYQENPIKFVAKSDVFIFTSETEGLPTVLIEAMICKVPVVSTPYINGKVEIVKDKTNGMLTSGWNPLEIADKVMMILDNLSLKQNLIKNAYRMSVNDFNKEIYIQRYTQLFLSMFSS